MSCLPHPVSEEYSQICGAHDAVSVKVGRSIVLAQMTDNYAVINTIGMAVAVYVPEDIV
jgi:hypothetical protein